MNSFDPGSFEAAFARRLREELDSLHVWLPATRPSPRRARRAAFASAAALAVGCALVLGTVAAFASGSPNPKVWIRDAEQSIGIPSSDSEPSSGGSHRIGTRTPEPSEAPPAQQAGGENEPPNPGAPRESPHPESPEPSQSPDPGERSPTSSPGDG